MEQRYRRRKWDGERGWKWLLLLEMLGDLVVLVVEIVGDGVSSSA